MLNKTLWLKWCYVRYFIIPMNTSKSGDLSILWINFNVAIRESTFFVLYGFCVFCFPVRLNSTWLQNRVQNYGAKGLFNSTLCFALLNVDESKIYSHVIVSNISLSPPLTIFSPPSVTQNHTSNKNIPLIDRSNWFWFWFTEQLMTLIHCLIVEQWQTENLPKEKMLNTM